MLLKNSFSPFDEMRSYETLWAMPKQTVQTISHLFSEQKELPSQVLERWRATNLFAQVAQDVYKAVGEFLSALSGNFSVSLHRDFQYPKRLRSAEHPAELLYYRGDIDLASRPSISIVGTRDCSPEGKARAARLAKGLSKQYTIISGLARGVDTAAMTAAMEAGGRTIGVIGTAITDSYPPENHDLQETIAESHLLLSHVPFYRSSQEEVWLRARQYFPWRNQTMAALSTATIVVEAGETSGTLIQARAALKQKRKLFILNSCFESGLRWPHTYEKRGAIRVRDFDDIYAELEKSGDGPKAVEEN